MSILGRHRAGCGRGGHLGVGARGNPDRRRGTERGHHGSGTHCPGSQETAVRRVPDRGRDQMSDPIAVLQRIRTSSTARRAPPPEEVCELCSETIDSGHRHLVDLRSRTLLCACRGCFLLFESQGAGGDHFRSVPERYVAVRDFDLSPSRWDSLQVPVSVAFFFLNSELGRIAAFYPGPAGAPESELPLNTWTDLFVANPQLATMQPDVE